MRTLKSIRQKRKCRSRRHTHTRWQRQRQRADVTITRVTGDATPADRIYRLRRSAARANWAHVQCAPVTLRTHTDRERDSSEQLTRIYFTETSSNTIAAFLSQLSILSVMLQCSQTVLTISRCLPVAAAVRCAHYYRDFANSAGLYSSSAQ